MTKANMKKLKEFIKDEKMGAKEYRKYGYPNLARDESRHRRFLLREMKKQQKK